MSNRHHVYSYLVSIDGTEFGVDLFQHADGQWEATVDDEIFEIQIRGINTDGKAVVIVDGSELDIDLRGSSGAETFELSTGSQVRTVAIRDPAVAALYNKPSNERPRLKKPHRIESPMTGVVLSVCVKRGDPVSAGDALVVFEAMKMETTILAPSDGFISRVFVNSGQTVFAGDDLLQLD